MSVKLQIVAGVILLLGLLWIINMIRKRKLELKYALSWVAVIVLMLVVDAFPPILSLISYLFGIATPVNTLFVLGFIFSLALLFVLTVAVSRLADRVRKLSQSLALAEKEIQEMKETEWKIGRTENDEKNNRNRV